MLQLSGRAMKTLTQINILDFDDSRPFAADRVDRVHSESAVANEPCRDGLSHFGPRFAECFERLQLSHLPIVWGGHLVTVF